MTIGERIKKVRKHLDLTQQEFADQIGSKRNTIATYEMGRTEPSAAVVSLVCTKFNVNETWLRTGEGEMFVELPQNEALAAQIQSFLQGGTDSFRERLVSLLLRLPPEHWEVLERYALELVNGSSTPAAPAFSPAHAPTIEEEADAVGAAAREQFLMEKRAEDTSSASPPDTGITAEGTT